MQVSKGFSSPKDAGWFQEEFKKKKKKELKKKKKGIKCQNAFVNQALDLKLMPKDLMGNVRSIISSFHIPANSRLRRVGGKRGNLGHCFTLKAFEIIVGGFLF